MGCNARKTNKRKYTEVHKNASTGSRLGYMTDRHDEANSRLSANFADAPKTPQELDMFQFSVKNVGLRPAPSDLIQQPYPHPKPYLRTEKTPSSRGAVCPFLYFWNTVH